MNINFVFVRHGYGCHNAIGNLINNKIITNENKSLLKSSGKLNDPELTPIGVDTSIHNGLIVNKLLKSLKIDEINVIGCSPLIRSMETAYFMSRKWDNPPKKIYVFPLLREIDESSSNKYSKESLKIIDKSPSYIMKTIPEQKQYLKSIGILEYFDFSFLENNYEIRKEPGDIPKFINWFNQNYISKIQQRNNLNVFIITHAGVLTDYSKEGFVNNSGFIVNGLLKNNKFDIYKYLSLNKILPRKFFKDYFKSELNTKSYYCPSNRCGNGLLCQLAKGDSSIKISNINF